MRTRRLEQEVERLEGVVRRRRVRLADVKQEAAHLVQKREEQFARAERSLTAANERLATATKLKAAA